MENSDERKSIDHEFVILFTEMDENESWLLDENIESFSDDPVATKALKLDAGFVASNKMKSINGYIYGNLPGLSMCQGDTVSWHMIGMGTWSDVHNRKCMDIVFQYKNVKLIIFAEAKKIFQLLKTLNWTFLCLLTFYQFGVFLFF